MCSYIGIKVSKTQYIKLKKIEKAAGILAALKTMQSGFEYADWAIIKATDDRSDIEIIPAHWEFIPTFIKNNSDLQKARKQGIPWLNATAEKLLSSKMFREAALKRRCLVPVSFFYEWCHHKSVGAKKPIAYPYCISIKDKGLFYIAGIYQQWVDEATGLKQNTFAIITTEANETMAKIHNLKKRMPTILNEDLAHDWLFKDLTDVQINEIATYQIDSNEIDAFTIAKDFRTLENPTEAFDYGIKALNVQI
jgi:putative SOS response-associated peptidase YedK